MLHKYQFSPFDLMCHLRLLFSLLILCLDDLSIAVIEVLKFPMILCYCQLFLLWLLGYLAYLLKFSYVGCIYIYNYCIFFLDWSPDHYVVFFFVSCNSLYFKVIFSDLNIIHDTIILLQKSMGKMFPDINHTNVFLGQSPKAREIKPK